VSMHALKDLPFTSVTSERWDTLPDVPALRRQIAMAALARCELTDEALGLYTPPKEVREVQLTHAAADQIRCMWHGHRSSGSKAPPNIPLKLFVTGFGQDGNGNTWANIEVHPGLANWEAPG
jgi:hypothetical protein